MGFQTQSMSVDSEATFSKTKIRSITVITVYSKELTVNHLSVFYCGIFTVFYC